MSVKGADETLNLIREWQQIIAKMKTQTRVVFDESGRIASAKDSMNERGSIKDRLAQTDEEAEVIAAAEAVRFGEETEQLNMSPEQEEAFEDEIAERLIDDMIEKTILRGN